MTAAATTAPFGLRRDLPRWRQLVTPVWLASLLAGVAPVAAPGGAWCLFEVGDDGGAQFAAGHIGGAGYIDSGEFEGGPLWNKVDDGALERLLLGCGIGCEVSVLLYSRKPPAAARAAHLMLYAGVRDVRLLDGGFAAWCAAALPLVTGVAPPRAPIARFGSAIPARPDYLCDMAEARAVLAATDGVLVSTRTWEEFIGTTSGYSYIAARGDIAGARWGRAGDAGDINSMSDFHDASGRMKPAAAIARMWQAAGIHPERRAVFYCGTGWRASLAFFYAWLMGWEQIAVFDGGWCEWSADSSNPVVCRVDEGSAGEALR